MRPSLTHALAALTCGIALLQAAPVAAQSEQQLRQAFEGRYVVVRMDMPATHKGVDVVPGRDPAVDFKGYSARLREFGIALREGTRVMVTAVRVKKKNIEFQLGGGGYGVMGDDSGSVYVPTVSKSSREKDLEKRIKNEYDSDRRRRMQRELDDLRREREREDRDRASEKRDLESRKQSEIADKRLDAGSRVNLWFADGYLENGGIPNPRELQHMLTQVVDFGDDAPRPTSSTSARRPPPAAGFAAAPAAVGPSRGGGSADLRRGLSEDEVHDLLGKPIRFKAGKQGDLSTLTEWYEEGDRVTEVVYVSGIVVRFSSTSK